MTCIHSLADVLHHVVQEITSVATDVVINCQICDLEEVDCDTHRIGQLVSNLLANAVRYGDRSKPIVLEARVERDQFHLGVVNQGDPIPEAAREKLFMPFQRGEVSNREKGLGLGLFIVREIAQAHGGEVRVFSDRSETRFQLTIPKSVALSM